MKLKSIIFLLMPLLFWHPAGIAQSGTGAYAGLEMHPLEIGARDYSICYHMDSIRRAFRTHVDHKSFCADHLTLVAPI